MAVRLRLNPSLLQAQYAVRGRLPQRAAELRAQGRETVACNIGNPQALGQQPLTYVRQLLSLHQDGEAAMQEAVPADILARYHRHAAELGSIGAYSDSTGHRYVREAVARFIGARDGTDDPDPDAIFCTNGASAGIQMVLSALKDSPDAGILVPDPQYPLYSATLCLQGTRAVPYRLDPANGWRVDPAGLDAVLSKDPMARAIVVINPGNPTGQVMTAAEIRDVLEVAGKHGVAVLADEVYQQNVFPGDEGRTFVSFRKVHHEMGSGVPLFSHHSTSKGLIGECGQRGGYMEMHAVDDDTQAALNKYQSISLCSNIPGQVCTEAMVNPPTEGDESYGLYAEELGALETSMERRANAMWASMQEMKGLELAPPAGSMYLYPEVELPPSLVAKAEEQGVALRHRLV